MEEITQKDERLMEAAREIMGELTEKTVKLYGSTDNANLVALKKTSGENLTSSELTAIMHMLVFMSDDGLNSKMQAAVKEYAQ